MVRVRQRVIGSVVAIALGLALASGCGPRSAEDERSAAAPTTMPTTPPTPPTVCPPAGPVRLAQPAVAVGLDRQGDVCWQTPLRQEPGLNDPPAVATSPTDAYVATGGSLVALRLADGRVAWTWDGPPVGDRNTPYSTGVSDVHLYRGIVSFEQAGGGMIGLDAVTGAVRWRAPVDADSSPQPTPGELLVVGNESGTTARRSFPLGALDLANGRILWTSSDGGYVASAAGVVASTSGGGPGAPPEQVIGRDARTGSTRWTWSEPAGVQATLEAVDGDILVHTLPLIEPDTRSPATTVLDAATGEVVRRYHLPFEYEVDATVPAGQVVDIGSGNPGDPAAFGLIDPLTGALRWQQPLPPFGTPAYSEHADITQQGEDLDDLEGVEGQTLVARSVVDGTERWTRPVGAAGQVATWSSLALFEGAGPPPASDDVLDTHRALTAHRLGDGSPAWQVVLPDLGIGATVDGGDRLVVVLGSP